MPRGSLRPQPAPTSAAKKVTQTACNLFGHARTSFLVRDANQIYLFIPIFPRAGLSLWRQGIFYISRALVPRPGKRGVPGGGGRIYGDSSGRSILYCHLHSTLREGDAFFSSTGACAYTRRALYDDDGVLGKKLRAAVRARALSRLFAGRDGFSLIL